jgi:hypothetical protein
MPKDWLHRVGNSQRMQKTLLMLIEKPKLAMSHW